ncbi:hypothetical protein [Arcanobacterium haemolyticum]|uniref:hypothetical protein n=1 Tax=Arcanobacterium haemolyticum TaxID=28264 RepID=UPI0011BE5B61|nr:hypothetical protein [Arcanobacterium haemolyticum]
MADRFERWAHRLPRWLGILRTRFLQYAERIRGNVGYSTMAPARKPKIRIEASPAMWCQFSILPTTALPLSPHLLAVMPKNDCRHWINHPSNAYCFPFFPEQASESLRSSGNEKPNETETISQIPMIFPSLYGMFL